MAEYSHTQSKCTDFNFFSYGCVLFHMFWTILKFIKPNLTFLVSVCVTMIVHYTYMRQCTSLVYRTLFIPHMQSGKHGFNVLRAAFKEFSILRNTTKKYQSKNVWYAIKCYHKLLQCVVILYISMVHSLCQNLFF